MIRDDRDAILFQPGKLWSLWDLMQNFEAGRVSGVLAGFAGFHQCLQSYNPAQPHERPIPYFLDRGGFDKLVSDLGTLIDNATRLDLRVTLSKTLFLQELLNGIPDVEPPLGLTLHNSVGISQDRILQIRSIIQQICQIVPPELSSKIAFAVPASKEKFIRADKLFGGEVEKKFSTARREISEAGKCFGLNRHTACVFHLMRVMEIGIKATAKCLGAPDPTKPADRNWGFILRGIDNAIKTKWPSASSRMAGDGAFFESVYASLDAVKNPWRNATMHVEQNYDEEDAEHIYAAVKGFMMKLSSRLDEQGLPLA